jgi:hypothetical protein
MFISKTWIIGIILFLFLAILLFIDFKEYNKRLVHKSITVNHKNGPGTRKSITLCWFRESAITSAKDFVTLTINNIEDTVLVGSDYNIADIDLRYDTILIKADRLEYLGEYLKRSNIGNYKVVIKQATRKEFFKSYQPDDKYFPLYGEK